MRAATITLAFCMGPWVVAARAQDVPSPAATAARGDDTLRPLPDGSELVRLMVDRQRSFEEAINDYTYDVVETVEELDGKDRVKARHLRRYEIFFVAGVPVRKKVEVDGHPLSPSDAAKEERRVRREAEKVRERKQKGKTDENPNEIKISEILDRYDFTSVARETMDGRSAVRVEFRPLLGKRKIKADFVLRALRGRLWIDEEEHVVLRAEIGNLQSIRIAGGVLASISTLNATIELRNVDQVWLPRRTDTYVAGRLLLLKGFRQRVVEEYSNYRRFEITTEEHVLGATD